MTKVKAVLVDYEFNVASMPVLRALNYCGSFPTPDKSRKPIYSDIFYNSEQALLEAEQKRNRKRMR